MPTVGFSLPGVPFKLSGQEASGQPSYYDSLMKGFNNAQTMRESAANLIGTHLKNKQAQLDLANAPLKQQLLQAQIQKALQGPQPVLGNYEKALQGAQRVEQQYGKDSPEAKEAKGYATRLAEGGAGQSFSFDPKTGAVTFSQGGRGGQGQQQIVTDENGNQTIVSKPTTPVSTIQQKTSLANQARQYVAENLEQPYVGTGSNLKLANDRYNYSRESDPTKKKEIGDRLVKAAVAAKIAPEYASLQLNAQGVTPTVSSLKEQENSIKQGWAEGLPAAVNNLPADLQKRAQVEHAQELQKLKDIRESYFVKGLPVKLGKEKSDENVIEYIRDANGRLVPSK